MVLTLKYSSNLLRKQVQDEEEMSLDAGRLWDEWNIRIAVLLSFFFQIILIISAKSRRSKGGTIFTGIVWLSYWAADWIAAFAVGLISSGQANKCSEKAAVNKQLAAFWAPFLLLHLGGPDAITAFSIEDNELWIRHLMGLIFQLVAVAYVFVQSLPNEYWIPTVLLFLSGVCKYAERTVSLYKACLVNFKRSLLTEPDPGPNYAQLMEEFSVLEASHVPFKIDVVEETRKSSASTNGELASSSVTEPEPLGNLKIVLKGYRFFDTFKGLFVDHIFSFRERDESRQFFLNRTAVDAFKVMEVELNFMYDALFTKMALMHCKIGYMCRLLSTALLVACFLQFALHHHHDTYHFDEIVSYVLLVGAAALEVLGILKLVFSDWAIALASVRVARVLIRLRSSRREQRWSDSIARHSFISFCLDEKQSRWLYKIAECFRVKETLDNFLYKKKTACGNKLKKLVFDELKAKALKAVTPKMAKEIYRARADYVLLQHPNYNFLPSSITASLSDEAEYDESLLLWHIATEMCYFLRFNNNDEDTVAEEDGTHRNNDDDRIELCKVLSDYMLYLLVMQPALMSTVAGIAQVRFLDTCEEAKKFFKRWQSELKTDDHKYNKRILACMKLRGVKTDVKPNKVKGDRSKSLLFDACILAKDLLGLTKDLRLEVMSMVWVELLSYGASRCRPSEHARHLSKGGELITFVWLLMVHFGLGEQFRIEAGQATTKILLRH